MSPIPEEFKSSRLVMRRLIVDMSADFVGLYRDNALELSKKHVLPDNFVASVELGRLQAGLGGSASTGTFIDQQDVQTWIAHCDQYWRRAERYAWGIFPRKDGVAAPSGVLQFVPDPIEEDGRAAHGAFCFWLGSGARGRGLMPEALSELIPIVRARGIKTVEISTLSTNSECIRVASKLGFKEKVEPSNPYAASMRLLEFTRSI